MKRFIPLVILMVVCMFSSIGLLAGSVSPPNEVDEIPYSYLESSKNQSKIIEESNNGKSYKEIHIDDYVIKYNDSIVEVYKDGEKIWESLEDGIYQIKDILVSDKDLGQDQVLVVYFKYDDDISEKINLEQHISLYSLDDNFKEIWTSPKIQSPIVSLSPCGKDDAGKVGELLCASVSSYDNYPKTIDTISYIWRKDMISRLD